MLRNYRLGTGMAGDGGEVNQHYKDKQHHQFSWHQALNDIVT